MRVVKEPLLRAFPNRIINIHPSLLPAFKGLRAWEQALAAGVTETGCTVHFVNEEVDGGAIIAQERVPVLPGDTPEIAPRPHPGRRAPAFSRRAAAALHSQIQPERMQPMKT